MCLKFKPTWTGLSPTETLTVGLSHSDHYESHPGPPKTHNTTERHRPTENLLE